MIFSLLMNDGSHHKAVKYTIGWHIPTSQEEQHQLNRMDPSIIILIASDISQNHYFLFFTPLSFSSQQTVMHFHHAHAQESNIMYIFQTSSRSMILVSNHVNFFFGFFFFSPKQVHIYFLLISWKFNDPANSQRKIVATCKTGQIQYIN